MKKIVFEKKKLYIGVISVALLVLIISVGLFIFTSYGTISKSRVKQIIYNKTKFKKESIDFEKIEEAKELVASDLGIDIKNVDFKSVKFKKDNFSAIYTIKVNYKNSTYEYTVDGISGQVLKGYTKITKNKKKK